MRSICKKADVTTGALYFFFQDKNDLFRELIWEPVQKLTDIMQSHYSYEDMTSAGFDSHVQLDFTDDILAAKEALAVMYDNFDAFYLVIVQAGGSQYENMLDYFIDVTEQHYRLFMNQMTERMGVPHIDDYLVHWFTHLQIEAFTSMIEHRIPKDQAMHNIERITKFFVNGFMGMLQ